MLAFRSVVSVLLRALGDFSLHPQGRPCGRPPAAAVLGRQTRAVRFSEGTSTKLTLYCSKNGSVCFLDVSLEVPDLLYAL
jgi:hypothetical protein